LRLPSKSRLETLIRRWDADLHQEVAWDGSHIDVAGLVVQKLAARYGLPPAGDEAAARLRTLFVDLMSELWWEGDQVVAVARTCGVDLPQATLAERLVGLPRPFRYALGMVLVVLLAGAGLFGLREVRGAVGPVELVVVECDHSERCRPASPVVHSERQWCTPDAPTFPCLRCAPSTAQPDRDETERFVCMDRSPWALALGTTGAVVTPNQPPPVSAAPPVRSSLQGPCCAVPVARDTLFQTGYRGSFVWEPSPEDAPPGEPDAVADACVEAGSLTSVHDVPGVWTCTFLMEDFEGVESPLVKSAAIVRKCRVYADSAYLGRSRPLPDSTLEDVLPADLVERVESPEAADLVLTASWSGSANTGQRSWRVGQSRIRDRVRTVAPAGILVYDDLLARQATYLAAAPNASDAARLCAHVLDVCGGFGSGAERCAAARVAVCLEDRG
jgi:hypothetical protein